MRTRTSPTSAGTVIQRSSTGNLSIGAAWTSSSTLRASAGGGSKRNGGVEVASQNSCEAGSRTTGFVVVMAMLRLLLWSLAQAAQPAADWLSQSSNRVGAM